MTLFVQVLGVDAEADASAIKKAYRKLSLVYHPDKNSANAERFNRLRDAYEILRDEDKRELYNIGGDTAVAEATKQQAQGRGIPRGPEYKADLEVSLETLYVANVVAAVARPDTPPLQNVSVRGRVHGASMRTYLLLQLPRPLTPDSLHPTTPGTTAAR